MKPLRYKYQTIEFGDNDIHLRTLKDKQQFSDKDKKAEDLGISSATWSLFGVVWPSSEVLEYRISQTVSVEGSYKTMNMSKSNHSYDYDTANLGVKFGF